MPSAPSQPAAPHAPGESIEVTVLLTDLRGFVALSESHGAHTVFEVLNRYLARMCEIAVAHDGRIDKFIGDSILVLFDATQPGADHARRAVTCAVQMQIAMNAINEEAATLGLPPMHMGAGICTGHVIAGMLGSALHSEYAVIGEAVNLASRIQSLSLRGQILVGESTFTRCLGFAAMGPPLEVHLKGRSQLLRLHEVLAIPPLGLQVPRRDMRKSPRVQVGLACSYLTLVNNIIVPERRHGIVQHLGYHGALVELPTPLTQHTEVLLEMELPLLGRRVRGIYARVRRTRNEGGRNLAGLEFTSIGEQAEQDIRQLVQLLAQGSLAVDHG